MDNTNPQGQLALFRFDASAIIGGGHAMRCLTLAGAMSRRGWQCKFAVGPDSLTTVSRLSGFGDDVLVLEGTADSEADMIEEWLGGECDLLIVDHYGRDAGFEKACRRFAKRIMVIDDLANRPHDCDFLLDQTFGRSRDEYKSLAPATCKFLLGSGYALIASDFFILRGKTLIERARRKNIGRVLVSFGLSDPDNMTEKALQGIAASGLDLNIDVVLGSGAPHLDNIRTIAAEMGPMVKLTTDATDMSERMSLADIAIGGGGTSSWERCCLGLPTLVVVVADNQKTVVGKLAQSGAVILLGTAADAGPEAIARNLCALADDIDRLKCMQQDAADICDGLGTSRVAITLATGDILLRPANMDDARQLLDWRNDALTRHSSIDGHEIPYEQHVKWLEDVLAAPDRNLRIAEISGIPIGTVRADRDDDGWKLSWTVAPEARGHGFGKKIVALMIRSLGGKIRAEIKSDNVASLRIAEALKMVKVSETQGLSVWTTRTNGD